MVADFQTSMQKIRESNLAFISLLTQLKRFIAGKGTVTVRTYRWDADAKVDVVDAEWEVPTIPSLIEAYRGGRFDEIILKAGSSEMHLKDNDGSLQIVDKDGALVPLEVSRLRSALIVGCTIDKITVHECAIDVLQALGGVEAKKANCQDLSVSSLEAASGTIQLLDAASLVADDASIRKLAVRSVVFDPAERRNVFTVMAAPYNYVAGNAVFESAPGSTYAYVCQPTPAQVEAGWKDPSTMGFAELPLEDGAARILQAPDMMTFRGNTRFSDYARGNAEHIANCFAIGTGPQGAIVAYPQALPVMTGFGEGTCCPFALILGWPIRSFVRDPSSDTSLPSIMQSFAKGAICLHEFSSSDIGRIVYIRTLGNAWRVPRRLTTKYTGGMLQCARLDLEYTVPAYTSLRLRLARYAEVIGADTYYHNVLELT